MISARCWLQRRSLPSLHLHSFGQTPLARFSFNHSRFSASAGGSGSGSGGNSDSVKPKPKAKTKGQKRLSKNVPENAQRMTGRDAVRASQLEVYEKLVKDKEKNYRFVSPNTAFWIVVGYLAISFACLGYVYYKDIPSSRLMYIQPFLLNINPERSHIIAVRVAQWNRKIRRILGMVNNTDKDPTIAMKVWHLKFPNPLGLAAGFDKHGECVNGMLDMGFGFVEVGSVTPKPQPGNPKPRVFRLKKDKAVINRYGFNSDGHDKVRERLERRIYDMNRSVGLLGVNLGKNKESESAVDDYVSGVQKFVDLADYLVVNVSSPNTPGLRDLQRREILRDLLSQVKLARDEAHDKSFSASLMSEMVDCDACKPPPPPLLVKISPDMSFEELKDVAEVVKDVGIDGIILTNTTNNRTGILSKHRSETGGLSGKPLFERSNAVLKEMYKLTNGEVPLIGVGGVMETRDVYEKIKCGASLVQVYTGLAYNGPVMVKRILRELGQYAELDGFDNLQDCVGLTVKKELKMQTKTMSPEEQELMAEMLPRPQRSYVAKWFGVINFE